MRPEKVAPKYQEFENYLFAMVEFYGRITAGEAFDIIQEQNKDKYKFADFERFLRRVRASEIANPSEYKKIYRIILPSEMKPGAADCDVRKYEIIHDALTIGDDDHIALLMSQKHHHRYIPRKEELFRYTDDLYTEITPPMKELIKWVLKHKAKNLEFELTEKDIAVEVGNTLHTDGDVSEVLQALLKWLDIPEDEETRLDTLDELLHLIIQVNSMSRMWALNGHTPDEESSTKVLVNWGENE